MLIYLAIFFSKIIENTLSTLRLIVVANGRKKIGAFLQGIVALVWIFVTGIVIIDINNDPLKIVFFCIGTIIGSYLGSVIEEKIALGSNMLTCLIDINKELEIKNKLKDYKTTTICEKNNDYLILLIILRRKEIHKVSEILKSIDSKCVIISEKAKAINQI